MPQISIAAPAALSYFLLNYPHVPPSIARALRGAMNCSHRFRDEKWKALIIGAAGASPEDLS